MIRPAPEIFVKQAPPSPAPLTAGPKRFKKVYIELTNVCNLQCPFCPKVDRDKQFMAWDLFQKVIRAVRPLTEAVCFHLMGEPLVHPHLDRCANLCHSSGLSVQLATNGLLLNAENSGILMSPAFTQINFSLQSFEANFPGRDNGEYLQRIFNFTRLALEKRPDLHINYRLWNLGAQNADRSNSILMDKIETFFDVKVRRKVDVRWRKHVPLKGRLRLHFDSRFEWPHPHRPIRSKRGFCHGLSTHIGILADGTVVPCCLDKEGIISLGHCGSQNISEILESPRAQSMREGFQMGVLVEDLCQKCTFISRFEAKKFASTADGLKMRGQ